jgi:hypothetical protein
MSARGDDLMMFYAADLGISRKLNITNAASAQIADADGALAPGRYLVQVFATAGGKPVDRCWLRFGKFETGGTITATTDVPSFPVDPDGVFVFELNVRPGYNDRLAGIVAAAGAAHTVYVTRIDHGRKV